MILSTVTINLGISILTKFNTISQTHIDKQRTKERLIIWHLYPILDLDKFKTDLGWYLRSLEEVIIQTLAIYGIKGSRSKGETGVWMKQDKKGFERKICAMGIKCSRWITMHGFAFNINTDLNYFNNIIPCGIQNKQVTSLQKELGMFIPMDEVKQHVKENFAKVFEVEWAV